MGLISPGPPVRRLTRGPDHHFFGYYDKTPWDPSGRYVLALRTTFDDRVPGARDTATLGVIDTHDGCRFDRLTETRTFSWQMGAMQHWLPDGERIVFNDRRQDRFVAVVRSPNGAERQLPRAIAALSHDARFALSLSFERLADVRPETGYPGVSDRLAGVDAPDGDGIHRIELDSGRSRLILSLAQIAALDARPSMTGSPNWVNHLTISPNDERLIFVHRWWPDGAERFDTRLCLARTDGTELGVLWPGIASHFAWRNDHELLFSGNPPDRPARTDRRFFRIDVVTGECAEFGSGVLPSDGHCGYRPGGDWILTDSYPDAARLQPLMLVRESDMRRIDLGRFYAPPSASGHVRCDLHPRWNPAGSAVCIDSVHEGSRQMYVLDVAAVIDAA